jgi:endonuclease/exonuclease/phosphatase family metal-dependent hydrolase
VEVIEGENPDVICLQEVARDMRRAKNHDQPNLLAAYFNATATLYQLNVRLQTGGYGNLILSRWPCRSQHHFSLQMNRKKPRGAQTAVIETPEGHLHVVTAHFGLAQRERHWQAERLLAHRSFREGEALPTLIAGDFNDWRDTLAAGPFAAHRFQHITAPPSRFRTFPAYMPVGSLDKAFYRGDIRVRSARVVHTALARRASDHLPFVIDFHVGTTPLDDTVT